MISTPLDEDHFVKISMNTNGNFVHCHSLCDTGSGLNCLSKSLLARLKIKMSSLQSDNKIIGSFCGSSHSSLGKINLKFFIEKVCYEQEFYVFENLFCQMILGKPFFKQTQAKIDIANHLLTLGDQNKHVTLIKKHHVGLARLHNATILPAQSEIIIPVHVSKCFAQSTVLLEPLVKQKYPFLLVAKCLVNLDNKKLANLRVLNCSTSDIHLSNKTVLAKASLINNDTVHLMFPGNEMSTGDHNHEPSQYSCSGNGHFTTQATHNNNTVSAAAHVMSRCKQTQPVDGTTTTQIIEMLPKTNHKHQHKYPTLTDEEYIAKGNALGFDWSKSILTETQKQQLLVLLGQYHDRFSTSLENIGECTLMQCRLPTCGKAPKMSTFYHYPNKKSDIIDKEVDKLLEHGLIEECEQDTPFLSNVVLVKKKDGSFRLCSDYRNINTVLSSLIQPLPKLSCLVDCLSESKPTIFSSLDVYHAFNQIPIHPDDRHKTAFITRRGVYMHRTLPYGLRSGTLIWQKVISKIFQSLNYKTMLLYADDLIIFNNSFEKHIDTLKEVFEKLRHANLTLNAKKCNLAQKEICYLGMKISETGIAVDDDKIKAIANLKQPQTLKQLRSFLGKTQFHKRHIKGYSKIASPLYGLLQQSDTDSQDKRQHYAKIKHRSISTKWTQDCENSFQTLKHALINPPVLGWADFDRKFILRTDAAKYGLGYELFQLDDNNREVMICYGGRALRKSEKNYSASELELLGIIFGIKSNHAYLSLAEFTLQTDHKVLTSILKWKKKSGRLTRWILYLSEYSFKVTYLKGSMNSADFISRLEHQSTDANHEDDYAFETIAATSNADVNQSKYTTFTFADTICATDHQHTNTKLSAQTQPSNDHTPCIPDISFPTSEMRQQQQDCPEFKMIYAYLHRDVLPIQSKLARKIILQSDQFLIHPNGLLYHIFQPRTKHLPNNQRCILQLALPHKYRLDVLLSLHNELVHPSAEIVYSELKTRYYWKNMGTDVFAHVKSCKECQYSKHQNITSKAPLSQRVPAQEPFREWFLDCGDVVKSSSGYQYFMVAVDKFSQLVEICPLKTQTAQELATAIYSNIFCRYGVGNVTMTTDRASCFTSALMSHMNKLFHVKHVFISPHHSQSNGISEVTVRRVKTAIRIYCRTGDISTWDTQLPLISMSFRCLPSTVTGLTPFEITHGKKMITPLDYAIDHLPNDLPMDVYKYLDNLQKKLVKLREMVEAQRAEAKLQQKAQYDKKHRAKQTILQIGQKVLLHNPVGQPHHPRKFQTRLSGPFTVLKSLPNNTYMLRDDHTQKDLKAPIHVDRLKVYLDPSPNTGTIFQHQNPDDIILPPDLATNAENGNDNTQTQNGDNDDDSSEEDTTPDPEIVKILRCQHYRNAKIYHVKLSNGKTCWLNESDVSDDMKQQFHIKYTLTGKRRKHKKT